MKRILNDQINILLLFGGNLEIPNVNVLITVCACGFRKLYPFKINSKMHGCLIKNKISLFPFSRHPGRDISLCVAQNKVSLFVMKMIL